VQRTEGIEKQQQLIIKGGRRRRLPNSRGETDPASPGHKRGNGRQDDIREKTTTAFGGKKNLIVKELRSINGSGGEREPSTPLGLDCDQRK